MSGRFDDPRDGTDGPDIDIDLDIDGLGLPFAGLDDSVPLLLLPIRVETRYRLYYDPPQLLVRVYPDQVHIERDVAPPTVVERGLAIDFWTRWHEAGDLAGGRTDAWRRLAGATGSRRARQLADALRPTAKAGPGLEFPTPRPPSGPVGPRPARAALLPNQWVVSGYDESGDLLFQRGSLAVTGELATGPSTAAPTWDVAGSGIVVDDALAWMVDYERAVASGMAVTIDLVGDAAPATKGVATLIVTGVDAGLDRTEAADALIAVLESHRGTDGLAFVAQGTPTNNTDDAESGWSAAPTDPASEVASGARHPTRRRTRSASPVDPTSPDIPTEPGIPTQPTGTVDLDDNADRFARLLGLGDDGRWRSLAGGAGTEFDDSQAMRIATFEVVLGVLARQLLDVGGAPGIDDASINQIRAWFIDHVTGGAPVPTIRIGAQPYGILPVRAALADADLSTVVGRVEQVTELLAADWRRAIARVPTIDHGATDSSTDLPVESAIAAILATQPHPARFEWRRLDSYDSLNDIERWLTPQFAYELALSALSIVTNPNLDAPYTYVTTLYGALALDDPLDTIERQVALWQAMEESFPGWLDSQGGRDPDDQALGFIQVVRSLLESYAARQYPLQQLDLDRLDAALAHAVVDGGLSFESPVNTGLVQGILSASTAEWGDAGLIETPDAPSTHSAANYLTQLRRAFDQRNNDIVGVIPYDEDFLAHPPLLYQLLAATDALVPHLAAAETRFSDALDRLASLDPAWLEWLFRESIGLGTHRLDAWHTSIAAARLDRVRTEQPDGLQIGAFGFVTDLVPSGAGEPSQGYIHAPSMGQATTAALLRAGWQAHGDADPESAFAIDLSSQRVRDARWLLDGVAGGQPLGELLGCRFERALHDAGDDHLIRPTRLAVLAALGRPDAPADQPVDGIDLLDVVRTKVVELDADGLAALATVEAAFDATNDVAIAEGVHQLAAGNHGRASAMLDAVATGVSRAPDAEILRTHRRGTSIEHRVVMLLGAGDTPDTSNGWLTGLRDRVAPQLEMFVAALLPMPAEVGFRVGSPGSEVSMTLAELGLSALDAIYLVAEDPSRTSAAFDTLVACVHGGTAGAGVDPGPSEQPVSFSEFGVLALEIRRLIDRTRVGDVGDLRPASAVDDATNDLDAVGAAVDALVLEFGRAVTALAGAISSGAAGSSADVVEPFARFGFACPGGPDDPAAVQLLLTTVTARRSRIAGVPADPGERRDPDGGRDQRVPVGQPTPPGPTKPNLPRLIPSDEEKLALLFSHKLPLLGTFVLAASSGTESVVVPDPTLAGADEVEEWLDAVGRVRPEIGRLTHIGLLADALSGRGFGVAAGQHPRPGGEGWVATTLPASPGGRLAVTSVIGPSGAPVVGDAVCALVVDRWVEQIPAADQVSGIAFHYDAPSNEAPQACLLAVTPEGRPWSLDLVLTTLLETLDWVRIRAVAPEDLVVAGRSIPTVFVPGPITPWTEEEA